jgi:hypothetical protein
MNNKQQNQQQETKLVAPLPTQEKEMTEQTQELATVEDRTIAEPVTESSTVLQIISQAATNPNVDIEKMERLLEMQERIFKRNAEQAFNDAMTAAQSEIPPIIKNKRNNQTNSNYADLEAINSQAMPIITRHGFSTSFGTDKSPLENHYGVTALVSHSGGHSRLYRGDIPLDSAGIKGSKNKTDTHAFGSTMSYGRRYLLEMIWNISTKDDDGNAAGNDEPISEEQMESILELISQTESDAEKFCKFMKIDNIKAMPLSKFGKAEKLLKAKLGQNNG